MRAQLLLIYSGSTGEVCYLTKEYNAVKSITSCLKDQYVFTGLQLVALLRSIDEDDSGGQSETEEADVLDWEICSSDKISDDEETAQFDDKKPTVRVDDLQTADTNVDSQSAKYFDNAGSGAAESSSTRETARDGAK